MTRVAIGIVWAAAAVAGGWLGHRVTQHVKTTGEETSRGS